MNVFDYPKVLALGVDSTSIQLVELWIEEGRLSNLSQIVRRGLSGSLKNPRVLSGAALQCCYTGTSAGRMGRRGL